MEPGDSKSHVHEDSGPLPRRYCVLLQALKPPLNPKPNPKTPPKPYSLESPLGTLRSLSVLLVLE